MAGTLGVGLETALVPRLASVAEASAVRRVLADARDEIPIGEQVDTDAFLKNTSDACRRKEFAVIEISQKIVGVIQIIGCEIRYIAVEFGHRRKGCAHALMTFAKWRNNGLYGKTRVDNEQTIALLLKESFIVDRNLIAASGWRAYSWARTEYMREKHRFSHSIIFLCICLAWVGLISCGESFAQLSTGESHIFDLRTKCQALSVNLADSKIFGSFWTQNIVSNYVTGTHRCYARIEMTPADLTTPPEKYEDDVYLFDAQTEELLAWTGSRYSNKYGIIYDEYYEKDKNGFGVASEYIRNLMRPDR